MKSKVGIVCIFLGIVLLLGALLLAISNIRQETAAQNAVAKIIPQLIQQIQEKTTTESNDSEDEDVSELELQVPVKLLTEEEKKMTLG